jgi:hypothetical protein
MKSQHKALRAVALRGLFALALAPAALAWQVEQGQSQKLDPTSPSFFHSMGQSVALDGDTLASGAPESPNSGPGCVYVHTTDGTSFTLEQKIDPPGGSPDGFSFGRTLALQGDTLVVGADRTAFVYTRSGGSWSLQQEIDPTSGTDANYASSIDIDGETVVIGQYGMTVSRTWIWVRSGTTWSVQTQLPGAAGSGFGGSVSIVGNTLAVGASADSQGAASAGAVFIFVRNGTTWSQQAKLIGDQPFANRVLGTSVDLQSLDGEFELAAGAANNSNSRVLLFQGSGATWNQTAQLFASTGGTSSWFGAAVALDGDRLLVGAWRSDVNVIDAGSATVYRRCGDAWIRQADFFATDGDSGDALGRAIALQGQTVVLGAPSRQGAFTASGATYVYDLGDSTLVTYCHGDGSGTDCPCNNEIPAGEEGGCRNSTGEGGLLLTTDDVQVGLDRLRAYACDLLPGQPALLFAGTQAIAGGAGTMFGDGLRCAGGTVARLGTQVPDANGDAVWGPGLSANGGWGAGDTRFLQVWYRNPSGGPCNSGFNLTNGVELTFEP